MDYIENRTYDEMRVGDAASISRTLTQSDIELFAVMSGDINPAHLDEEYAKSDVFQKVIAHGMWGGALISAVLGTKLPGPGTIYLGQTLKFRRPVTLGDTITVSVTVAEKDDEKKKVVFECLCANQDGKPVIEGTATVLAPTEKVRRPAPHLPEVMLHDRGAKLRHIIAKAEGLAPVRTAVAQPVHDYSLAGAVEAARAGLIDPVLIGPEDKILAAAAKAGLDISAYPIVDAEHSHRAAAQAVAMARAGEVEAIMMSSHYAGEIMRAAVTRYTGIRTNRRMSHVCVVDMLFYAKPLLVTDAYINTDPSFEDKTDIVRNAIEMARLLGIEVPKVALLAATHTVQNQLRSTMEAAALCKMADRGQLDGGLVEGPLTYDMAVSVPAARLKGVESPVAGDADVVVCPDLEAAHLLVKQLTTLSRALSASIVLGARVPIILPSQGDETVSRLTSCALAALIARGKVRGSGQPRQEEPDVPEAARATRPAVRKPAGGASRKRKK